MRAYRKDLVAALILAAPENEDELADLVLRYRKAAAEDAALGAGSSGEVLQLRPDKPGRRPRAG